MESREERYVKNGGQRKLTIVIYYAQNWHAFSTSCSTSGSPFNCKHILTFNRLIRCCFVVLMTADQDFVAAITNVTIVAGETMASFNLTIIQDSNLEVENETLTVGLQETGTVCVVPAADVPIVIIDSDGKSCD